MTDTAVFALSAVGAALIMSVLENDSFSLIYLKSGGKIMSENLKKFFEFVGNNPEILEKAKALNAEAAKRILIKGTAEVSLEAAKVFAGSGILLLGNESQTIGPEDEPMEVHQLLLGADVILLEGIRLSEVSEGCYFLNAAPLNLSGSDGSPCRAVLIDSER